MLLFFMYDIQNLAISFSSQPWQLLGEISAVPVSILVLLLGGIACYLGLLVARCRNNVVPMVQVKQARIEELEASIADRTNSINSLADGLDIALFICDPKATVLYANRRATDLFKFGDATGRTILAITLNADLEKLVLDAFHSQEPQQASLTFSYPDEKSGQAKAWVGVNEAHRVFLSIYETTDLRRLERVRQDFVANVSHELRTPMTVIRAMAETLFDEDEKSDTATRYLPKIISEVDRLSMITQDLLVLSTAESNPVRKTRCDVVGVIENVMAQLDAKAKNRNLDLSFEGEEHLDLELNESQITQAVYNLVDNALNYTPSGYVKVKLTSDDENATLTVEDSGLGIATEHQKRIFERFYRVDKSRSRATGGTGLGLSIVKHMIEAHDGTISLSSVLGEGSTFTIRLPLLRES